MPIGENDLEPLDPKAATKLFLEHKAVNCTESTVQNHRYRLKHFLAWCDEEGIDNLNDLSGREIQRYRLWLGEKEDLNKLTIKNMLSGLRVFLKWSASVEAVPENLYTKLMIPRVKRSERSRNELLESERAEEILEYLSKYQYASTEHVIIALLWETGMRVGAANSIDIQDVDCDRESLQLEHRPDQGTTLKNGNSGERLIAITTELARLIEDYVETNRDPITDEFGREPLFTTAHGRMHRNSIRRTVYRVTSPCYIDKECPDCKQDPDKKCPEAANPHAIRRGSITHFLTNDVPVDIVGDRMNVSRDVLEEHYDERSPEVKAEQRRKYLDNI
ncbi:tyrosine-type recombinase/integrase [Halobellus ordinarius]|uniref:tyrosine-type recombinase/integrase n=1 Tax=Halobellus ordinarius TaxID=3075120 RepID=UPI0028805A3F|nr:tyrosine-type recombinase/integrase [Halobellus sp. ZY16]